MSAIVRFDAATLPQRVPRLRTMAAQRRGISDTI